MDMPDGNFFLKVFDSITDPLAIYDPDLKIRMVNRALVALYQRTQEEIMGRPCYEVFHGRDRICDTCHVQEVFQSGKTHRREKTISLPDGCQHQFQIHCYPILDSQGNIVQAIEHGRDITESRLLSHQLQVSEERYRTIVENVREGIFAVDAETGRFLFANKFLAAMLGYRPKELLHRSVFEFMDENAARKVKTQFERRRHGLADVYELNLRKKDGSKIVVLISATPMKVNGSSLGSVGIVTDITPLKAVQAELWAAREFQEKIINGITDNLLVIDPRTFHIVKVNDSFLSRVGQEAAAVLGRPCYEVMMGKSRPCEENGTPCPVRETAKSKEHAVIDRVYPDARGRERRLQISTYPLLDHQGEVDLVIRLESDVTEKRQMEEALAFRSRELQKMQYQMETLFEVSRQISSKNSLRDLVDSAQVITREIFPESDPIFLILDAGSQRFLSLEECHPEVVEPLGRLLHKLEHSKMSEDFLRYLQDIKDPQIITNQDRTLIPPFLAQVLTAYPSWFGFPIFLQQQAVGYFLLGSLSPQEYLREDLHFLHALYLQIAGYMRHLVVHEVKVKQLNPPESEKSSFGGIIGKSKKMQEIYELIGLISGSDATVLITGENGTGKELVAQAIHRLSHRHRGPFIVANCSAYSPTLLESELFGHERGAFTGAIRQRKGRMERAHGGTLFLDEIGDISPATQVLLLRFLQDHCFERVGAEKTIAADVRVVAATNRDLRQAVDGGRFRDDLYYRLNVISIHLPPLRDRKEDIPLLAMHFLKKYNLKEGKQIVNFAADAMEAMMDYDWPGNVRQLENAISHAVILSRGEVIHQRYFPRFLRDAAVKSFSTSLAENERELILKVLQESNWNKHDAARRLQVSRSTLYSKIRRYDLEKIWGGSVFVHS